MYIENLLHSLKNKILQVKLKSSLSPSLTPSHSLPSHPRGDHNSEIHMCVCVCVLKQHKVLFCMF